jgi:pyruvate/2-oxoglutarate/acetoin dehydrogenase E1 component
MLTETYQTVLKKVMTNLGNKPDTVFIGQQIVFPGNPMSTTLTGVSKEKMIEVPVMEETQMGMTLGLAMTGKTVITFYPRWDFLILATNQLVNHIDKFELMTGRKPNILIRVGKGSDTPLDPGHQHKGNYFDEFSTMCKNIIFHDLTNTSLIEPTYENAYRTGIHVLVEYPQLYSSK